LREVVLADSGATGKKDRGDFVDLKSMRMWFNSAEGFSGRVKLQLGLGSIVVPNTVRVERVESQTGERG
jgi:hypothetical protein